MKKFKVGDFLRWTCEQSNSQNLSWEEYVVVLAYHNDGLLYFFSITCKEEDGETKLLGEKFELVDDPIKLDELQKLFKVQVEIHREKLTKNLAKIETQKKTLEKRISLYENF